jgi:hypothetical protein
MKATARRASVVLVTMTLGLSPSAALAAGAKKVTQGDGTILAHGAAITVPATFSCPAGYVAYLTAQVVQAIGEEFAGGFDTTTKECSGKKQQATFFIQAQPAGDNTRPFQVGEASSRVILDAVDPASLDPYYGAEGTGDPSAADGQGAPTGPLPPIPPLGGPAPAQYSTIDDPMPTEPAPTPPAPPSVHGEARGTIQLKEKPAS